MSVRNEGLLGGGNSNSFYFHPELWGRFPYFSDGLGQPPTSLGWDSNSQA